MSIDLTENAGSLKQIVRFYSKANKRLMLLDYDGTLVPLMSRPEQAKPSSRVLSVIKALTSDVHNTVVIISGRDQEVLDSWLGHLPVQFFAEHGEFEKRDNQWLHTATLDEGWKNTIQPLMVASAHRVPGSLIEEKKTSLVFHYRNASDKNKAIKQAKNLFNELLPIAKELGLRITHDKLTIEIQRSNADKGLAALSRLVGTNYDFMLSAGDSETDENMFKKLSDRAISVKIGPGNTVAAYRVASPEAFVDFLASLAELRE